MTIGDRIKKLREGQELTQDELAKYINSTKQTIYKYENNIVTNIPSDKIEKIAEILHTTPSYLMGWDDQTERIMSYSEKLGNKKLENELLKSFSRLTVTDKKKVINYTEKLVQIQDIEKEQEHLIINAAHERTDIEITEEDRLEDERMIAELED
jgi:transcriptional regulator with XRE-family HTH domain